MSLAANRRSSSDPVEKVLRQIRKRDAALFRRIGIKPEPEMLDRLARKCWDLTLVLLRDGINPEPTEEECAISFLEHRVCSLSKKVPGYILALLRPASNRLQ